MCARADAGIVKCVTHDKSIDGIKKRTDHFISFRDCFIHSYGPHQPPTTTTNNITTTVTTSKTRTNIKSSLLLDGVKCNH